MRETIKTKQENDLLIYYVLRGEENPERNCATFVFAFASCLGCIAGNIINIPSNWKATKLQALLAPDIEDASINAFVEQDAVTKLAALASTYFCLHCIYNRTANL